ncbi:TPA: ParB-like nuclease domain-containing protein [Enterobacter hormaechei subsp. steigerwaltii]|jgi:ParB-like chromosome segregation protein Spo0J|uniref:IbrB-like domain-containing protein n=1 Tax=Enterobacter TaxID=547 RepID=UPI002856DE42|nr:ParB-like nuclease domain-containing protein [Enterobacter hormaechei subsp. steigerwaltii]HCT3227009.1 ParB-like nuclease domain-containing protein [Enterobacter hormaechei]HAV1623935.1 ParB-like nuclease domain-containing protein [Enterobacter hormaechei subsp. steigerwaltii]HAV1658990.1 ParB-like nuclease domain-containing protein [Enterobacter hormaechei subsp. steigerwaltii]HAV1897451.1 ParB-like nuclease domain-containing protein [Enterobacter hormaechei subsp. steigerwaltii]
MRQRIITEIDIYLQSLTEEDRINAINAFRQAIHKNSPFREQPIDCVLWVKQDAITANDYNPNNVAPPEKRLLIKSLELDGFTQPIVVTESEQQQYEIVDGFHRHEIGTTRAVLKRQLKGYLPVTCLRQERQDKHNRMAATIRHNRARGRHQINAMSEIVRELVQLGWDDEKIGKELGMDSDEVLRLKQINGLLELFADRRFSEAWTVK